MKNRYITRGIAAEVPPWLQNLMWFLWDSMAVEHKDYLQIFKLSRSAETQRIVHLQEQPPYRKELAIPAPDAINAKIYIIAENDYETMLLADEY